jgi:hypothetical protein
MMPGRYLAHSGTRRIEFLEDPRDDVWEINLATQTLIFTGLVRTTTGFGGQPTTTIVTHETTEMILPLQRLYLALHDMGVVPPVGPDPQEPIVPPVVDPVDVAEQGGGGVHAPEEEDPEEEPEEDPEEYLEEGEFIGGDPNGHV